MDDYIAKPISPDSLKTTLARWLPQREAKAEQEGREPKGQGTKAKEAGSLSQPVPVDRLPVRPPLDLGEALARVDGDKVFLNEMVEIFLTEYPRFLSQIQTAVTNKDCEVLMYAAHTLKGSVGNFVATDTFEAARILEQMGRQRDLSEAPAALARLEAALNRLTAALANLKLEFAA
jgi:HPt (histidine-containing phosphotransfer) domain-containing protein